MITQFLTVGQQVFILFSIILVGVILGKTHLMNEHVSMGLSNLMIYVVSPCALVVAFQRPLKESTFFSFCMALLASTLIQIAFILVTRLLLRDRDPQRQRILQFGTVFSNSGYMGYPLQVALLGTIGMFYGSAFVIPFTVLTWTYGIYLITGDRSKLSFKKLLLNPGMISVFIAMALYLLRISLPPLLLSPVNYIAQLNTSVPMLIIGYQLSQADVRKVLKCRTAWFSALLRLLILPTLALLICLAMHIDGTVLIALTIAASAPPAAILVMFSEKFGQDARFSSSLVSIQTVFSILTMPVIVGIAQYLA